MEGTVIKERKVQSKRCNQKSKEISEMKNGSRWQTCWFFYGKSIDEVRLNYLLWLIPQKGYIKMNSAANKVRSMISEKLAHIYNWGDYSNIHPGYYRFLRSILKYKNRLKKEIFDETKVTTGRIMKNRFRKSENETIKSMPIEEAVFKSFFFS